MAQEDLYNTQRWMAGAVPLADGNTALQLRLVYCPSGSSGNRAKRDQTERLLAEALAEAAAVGRQPPIIYIDINLEPEDSEVYCKATTENEGTPLVVRCHERSGLTEQPPSDLPESGAYGYVLLLKVHFLFIPAPASCWICLISVWLLPYLPFFCQLVNVAAPLLDSLQQKSITLFQAFLSLSPQCFGQVRPTCCSKPTFELTFFIFL